MVTWTNESGPGCTPARQTRPTPWRDEAMTHLSPTQRRFGVGKPGAPQRFAASLRRTGAAARAEHEDYLTRLTEIVARAPRTRTEDETAAFLADLAASRGVPADRVERRNPEAAAILREMTA